MKGLVYFATSNLDKFEEARRVLSEYKISVVILNAKTLEIQADELEEIAASSAAYVVNRHKLPVIVEDAGLFIKALNNFPGPYSSFVLRTIGNRGILKLMEGVTNRRAEFQSIVAFCAPNMTPKCFRGVVEGVLSLEERGTHGFGFDPIFIPLEGDGRTFGEMTAKEKNRISHRARALRGFAEWYQKYSFPTPSPI